MSQIAPREYWLPPHIRACATVSGTVVLDLNRNRYFGLGSKETRALATLALNWADPNAVVHAEAEQLPLEQALAIADQLVQAGLLTTEASANSVLSTGHIELHGPLTSAGHQLNRTVLLRPGHVFYFLRACLWARRSLQACTLYDIAHEVSRSKHSASAPFDAERAAGLVGVFRRMRPHTFAARDRCLFHALALVRFLASHDLFATWVIGVRMKPWAAHSWVQQGSLLLDASPEQVCEYTPILAV